MRRYGLRGVFSFQWGSEGGSGNGLWLPLHKIFGEFCGFLPARRYASVGTSCSPVSVSRLCMPQVGVLSKWMDESGWFLAWELSFDLSYSVLLGNSGTFKNKGTSRWNFTPNSGHRKFCHSIQIIHSCCQLRPRKVDAQRVIHWTVVHQLKLTVPPSSDSGQIVYHIDRQALQHDSVAWVN